MKTMKFVFVVFVFSIWSLESTANGPLSAPAKKAFRTDQGKMAKPKIFGFRVNGIQEKTSNQHY